MYKNSSSRYAFIGYGRRCLVIVVLALWGSAKSVAQSVSREARQHVLEATKDSLQEFATMELVGDYEYQWRDSQGTSVISEEGKLTIRRSENRAFIDVVRTVSRPKAMPVYSEMQFIAYENGDVLQLQTDLDSDLHPLKEEHSNRSLLLSSKQVARTQYIDSRRMYWGMNDSAVGIWVVGYMSIVDQLDQADEIEVSGDELGYEVMAKGNFGILELSVSKVSHWFPTRIILTKLPSDTLMDGTVASASKGKSDPITSVRWDVGISGFDAVSTTVETPKLFKSIRKTTHHTGVFELQEVTVRLSKLDLSPHLAEGDFTLTVPLPRDYRIYVVDAPNLPFKWDGTKPVPVAPELLPSDFLIEQHGSRRFWLLFFNGLIVISVAGWLYWRRNKRQ